MYSHCYHCIADLGTNTCLATLPVGPHLVFDPSRGRLWVVCTRCGNWNLAPLENRWEQLRECEEAFDSVSHRVGSGKIAVARVADSLELVRIGDVDQIEYAVWRYGNRLLRRRRRFIVLNSLWLMAYGVACWSAWLFNTPLSYLMAVTFIVSSHGLRREAIKDRVTKELSRALGAHPDAEVRRVVLTGGGYHGAKLRSAGTRPGALDAILSLTFLWPGRSDAAGRAVTCTLSGSGAALALAVMLPILNREGSSRGNIEEALRELEAVDRPENYFAVAEARGRKLGRGYGDLAALPIRIRLALEMAAHADEEQRLFERGELARLEELWRHAEEIATIADGLASGEVEPRLAKLKAGPATGEMPGSPEA